jgi:sterol desaturase/sphingolipid hydroxylase (fatty acid hydroxylase superfamily)
VSWTQLILWLLTAQAVFIALDAWQEWKNAGFASIRSLFRAQGTPLLFLAGIWAGYFLVQASIAAVLPSGPGTLQWFAERVGLGASAPASGKLSWIETAGLGVSVFFVAGFWDYAIHRWFSHSKPFWFTHENHHLPRIVNNAMPGISVRPLAGFASFLTLCGTTAMTFCVLRLFPLPYVGAFSEALPAAMFVAVSIGSASHSSFLRAHRCVHTLMRRLLLTTPQEHILHHAARLQGNYGNFTTIWDRLFGTYLDPDKVDMSQVEIGLAYDQDFLGTLTWGRWKFSPQTRRRYRLGLFCQLANAAEPNSSKEAR